MKIPIYQCLVIAAMLVFVDCLPCQAEVTTIWRKGPYSDSFEKQKDGVRTFENGGGTKPTEHLLIEGVPGKAIAVAWDASGFAELAVYEFDQSKPFGKGRCIQTDDGLVAWVAEKGKRYVVELRQTDVFNQQSFYRVR